MPNQFIKRIKEKIKPRENGNAGKSYPALRVGPANQSFPREIPGRTPGERGLQTSLSVSDKKKKHPKLKVGLANQSFPREIKGRTAGERGLQTSLSVSTGKKQPKVKVTVRKKKYPKIRVKRGRQSYRNFTAIARKNKKNE